MQIVHEYSQLSESGLMTVALPMKVNDTSRITIEIKQPDGRMVELYIENETPITISDIPLTIIEAVAPIAQRSDYLRAVKTDSGIEWR